MEIVFCGTGWYRVVDFIRERLWSPWQVRARDRARPLVDEVSGAAVILPSNALVDGEVMRAARGLRLIQQPAVGSEGIDLDAARALSVPVCNAPAANDAAVAEAALLLMLALARRLPAAERAFRAREIGVPLGIELADKTLGIVGLGKSGTRLKRAAEGLGMRVLAVTSKSSRDELWAMCAEADVLSLHCPLTRATRGLVDHELLSRIKPGALLVNCARGGIIDRAALEAALEAGRLGGVGLDTYWDEPWDPDDPLFAREQVVTLPHVAGSTVEAFARVADVVVENIRRLERGEPLLHRIA